MHRPTLSRGTCETARSLIDGLCPLLGTDAETFHALADIEDLVPRLGEVKTVDLGRDPGYSSPAETLTVAGIPDDDGKNGAVTRC